MSTEPRTVTVTVLVSKSLEIDEPAWCAGDHPGANYVPDITHNGPEVSARFETRHGPVDYLTAWITQAPYGELSPEPQPMVAVEFGGNANSLDPDTVRSFTALTRAHLDILDVLANECDRLREIEGP
ncbi:hypothetical protein ABZT02_07700 [Streptomyces sp. NPDC005402]|uniref:DUF6907 domain-containing protein n=1 Tax=Streptomyces sp. NPDC005402 TaxID=3155338 RepID=UPI00339EE9BC